MVGHSTVLMTKHYLHVHPSIQQDAVDKFARAFGETKPPSLDDQIREAEKKWAVGEGDAAIKAKEKEER